MCTRPHSRKQRCFRCLTGIFWKKKIIFFIIQIINFLGLLFSWCFLHLQYYIATTNIGTVGIRLAEYKSTWVDKHTSHAIVGVSVKYWRFFMVRYKYSQRSVEVPLSRRIGSSCRSGFRNLPSRYRELHSGFDKSHNTTISAQLVPVSHIASRSNF